MREALESLLKQDYPALYPVIVTATADEPAAGIARELQARYPQLRHVVAGFAKGCGQKNHDSLKGVEAVEDEVELLAFCDSTHIAPRRFHPPSGGPCGGRRGFQHRLSQGRGAGYGHRHHGLCPVRPADALSAGRLKLTQLWGGAMCFRLSAFRRYGVREFWMSNVVDDCSLADRLIHLGARIRLSGDAVLMTEAREHDLGVWHHWMDRQILFLKFCIPYQWVLLGVLACLMLLPVLWAVFGRAGRAAGQAFLRLACGRAGLCRGPGAGAAQLADFQEAVFPVWRWMVAFCASACMFVWVYLGTILAEGVLWQGIWYEVGRQGRVIRMRAPEVGHFCSRYLLAIYNQDASPYGDSMIAMSDLFRVSLRQVVRQRGFGVILSIALGIMAFIALSVLGQEIRYKVGQGHGAHRRGERHPCLHG